MSLTTFTPISGANPAAQFGGLQEDAEQQYAALRDRCIEAWGPGFCNSVLPRNMIYAITRRDEGFTLPWWAWLGMGFLAAKLVRF